MKFEDSCFALCPPRSALRPSFVFVVELFQLANKTCPTDRVVAWTAMPMCGEHMGVVEGKFRLPLLRGEHTPSIQHFRAMEQGMAADLNNWLCNIYFEIRHLPLSAVPDLKTLAKPPFLSYDFVNKRLETARSSYLLASLHAEQEAMRKRKEERRKQKILAGEVVYDQEEEDAFHRKLDHGIFRRKIRVTQAGPGAHGMGKDLAESSEKTAAAGDGSVVGGGSGYGSADSGDENGKGQRNKSKSKRQGTGPHALAPGMSKMGAAGASSRGASGGFSLSDCLDGAYSQVRGFWARGQRIGPGGHSHNYRVNGGSYVPVSDDNIDQLEQGHGGAGLHSGHGLHSGGSAKGGSADMARGGSGHWSVSDSSTTLLWGSSKRQQQQQNGKFVRSRKGQGDDDNLVR